MSQDQAKPAPFRLPKVLRRIDPAVATAFACIVALLLVGSLYSSNFLSADYLLQQLQVGSFLAMAATGMMIVVLLGQIESLLEGELGHERVWVISRWAIRHELSG